MNNRFLVTVPASTSNLGAGFDTLSAALSLYLKIGVEVTEDERVEWVSGWDLPLEENIADAALRTVFAATGIPGTGMRLSMNNPIPLKRGLGSSGAAIIAGIKVAEAVSGRSFNAGEVLNLAYPLEGHPDNISASLLGGWVLSWVSGSTVCAERIDSRLSCRFVLAVPELAVSTKEARTILPETYGLADSVYNLQRCALFVHALHTGRPDLLGEASRDRLHQPYRARLVPGIGELLERRHLPDPLQESLIAITISGSGSAIICMVRDRCREVGEWMVQVLGDQGTAARYLVLDLDRAGARIEWIS
jgi:homoserine kinase